MPNPWLSIDVDTNPSTRARSVQRAWEASLSAESPPLGLRSPLTESWRRSASAGALATGRPSLPVLAGDEVSELWAEHPLARVVPLLIFLTPTGPEMRVAEGSTSTGGSS